MHNNVGTYDVMHNNVGKLKYIKLFMLNMVRAWCEISVAIFLLSFNHFNTLSELPLLFMVVKWLKRLLPKGAPIRWL